MSWADKAKDAAEGGHGGAKMAEGYHRLEVVRCIRAKKNGEQLITHAGPYLMVVYEDETGAVATCNYWITNKAQWKLIRDMARLGVDMDSLDERGVKLEHFLDAAFATDELGGRTSPGYAEPDGKYVNVEVLSPDDVPEKFRADCGLTVGAATADPAEVSAPETVEEGRSAADVVAPVDVDAGEVDDSGEPLPF